MAKIYHHLSAAIKQVIALNSKMKRAYIRRQDGEENIILTFNLMQAEHRISKIFNFKRSFEEPISSTIQRIRTNYEKEFKKKNRPKKKKGETEVVRPTPVDDIPVEVLHYEQPVSVEQTWKYLFSDSSIDPENLVLKVIDQHFDIKYNYPFIDALKLPTCILSGYDCYPSQCSVIFADVDECLFEWYRSKQDAKKQFKHWEKCGESFLYRVKDEDVNHHIKVRDNSRKKEKITIDFL